MNQDVDTVVMALMQDLDLGDTPEEQEKTLLDLADTISAYPHLIEEQVVRLVRRMRLTRGACPDCGERLDPVERRGVEYHPYGMGVAVEEWVEVVEMECPLCGNVFDREEVGDRVW